MIYYVDIDGTICDTRGGDYQSATPIKERINHLNELFDAGHTIIYWTARGTGSGVDHHDLTKTQLKEWGVKYAELKMQKPVYDVWVDDKAPGLKAFFERKTVAVVCSAAYLSGMGFGKEIDSADIVVRVNHNYKLVERHGEDIGTKTNVVYLCGSMYRARRTLKIPSGSVFRKVNTSILGARANGYVANTGVRAIIDYALAGHEVRAYGMDFYASANNGVIPQGPVLRNNGRSITFNSDNVYLQGYKEQQKTTISHVGGQQDVALLLRYMRDYPIYCDKHMKEILDNYNGLEYRHRRKLIL